MKIAIISDTHFGARNDSPIFLNYSLEYFENTFFPYLQENNIQHVIHLGDLFDRRKYINFNTLSSVRTKFIDKFQELNIKLHIILGNHDVYYKNTNYINSVKELFSKGYDSIKIYEFPTEVVFDGICLGLVPWINPENFEESIDFIQNNSCSILCGHLEINGFEVMAGIRHEGGVERFIFSNYDKVLSGHFHLKQTHGNIQYLGTQYQLSFADVGSKKGFHILDTNTRNLEFIENKHSLFYLLKYDDSDSAFEKTVKKVKFDKYKNCFIKIVVLNKKNQNLFDEFVGKITDVGVQQLQIVEDNSISSKLDDADVDVSEDTITIISKEIDSMEGIQDKNKLKLIIKDLYMESLSI